jgi:hypothetical protein
MDEEDGRPGPRARQFGPFDVPRDVLVRSLCRLRSIPEQVLPLTRIAIVLSRPSFRTTNQKPNPASFLWRGPAEGVGPTAGAQT